MKELKLNREDIINYQQNRDPYLMIDGATKVIPGKSAEGYKDLKNSEWFFDVHWPGDPNMPGMLQVEALIQMSALIIQTLPGKKGTILYLANADKIKFFKKVTPISRLNIFSKLLSDKRGLLKFFAEGYIDKLLAVRAEFTLVIPGSIELK